MALEFREPNITKLQRSMTWRQYRRWRMFDRIHPIDSRERIDAAVARAGYLTATAMGAKDLTEDGMNVSAFKPDGEYKPPQSQVKRKKPADSGKSDINTIIAELGASDGRKRR